MKKNFHNMFYDQSIKHSLEKNGLALSEAERILDGKNTK